MNQTSIARRRRGEIGTPEACYLRSQQNAECRLELILTVRPSDKNTLIELTVPNHFTAQQRDLLATEWGPRVAKNCLGADI